MCQHFVKHRGKCFTVRTEIVPYRIYKVGNKLLRTVKFFVFCTILEAVRSLYSVSWHEL
jgi:hypothetical protein